MTEHLKKIPQIFRTNGLLYTLLQRRQGVALYEVSGPKKVMTWEIHLIRKKRYPSIFGDSAFTHMEVLGKNEDFGTYAWNVADKTSAWKRFERLSEQHKEAVA